MIEHVLDLGNQLKKELETSMDFVIDSYNDLLIVVWVVLELREMF